MKIITNRDALEQFINLLPNNKEEERYMLYLFARKKYNYVEGLKADKCQLKRIMCRKKDIVDCLEKLEVKQYKFGDILIPQDNLVVYIQPNPRDMRKAARETQSQTVTNLLDSGNLNVKSIFYNEMQKYAKDKRFFMLDVDWETSFKEEDLELLTNILTEILGYTPLRLKTKNGVHVLIETEKIISANKNKWYNSVKAIKNNNFKITMSADNMCVIAGAIQANFSPYILL